MITDHDVWLALVLITVAVAAGGFALYLVWCVTQVLTRDESPHDSGLAIIDDERQPVDVASQRDAR